MKVTGFSLGAAGIVAGYGEAIVLRVDPGSYWGLTKLSDHQADGSPAQERKAVAVEAFPVLGQAATSVEPCNGSFDDPAFG